jgi:hypothetical protein
MNVATQRAVVAESLVFNGGSLPSENFPRVLAKECCQRSDLWDRGPPNLLPCQMDGDIPQVLQQLI